MRLNRLWLSLLATLALVATARADTGVSDERVSLPDGPGSIGGVGENASLDANMGMLGHAVPLELPEGFSGATPSLALAYSSGAGNEALGIGWMMHVPHIERFSLRGLPRYDADDVFAADGSEELVLVSGPAQTQVFRARFEGGFVRYTWHADQDGKAGYFVAEYPDGRRGFFGADESGQAVESARLTHPDGGVFRYLLVATVDRFGHAVRYRYKKHGAYPLLDEVSYLFTGTKARYRVSLAYETRSDVISSALGGFDLLLDKRLSEVRVLSGDTVLRRYALAYTETPAGTSQLTRVSQYGLADALFPVVHSFSYSQALAACDDCEKPVMVDMGSLSAGGSGGVDLQNGRSTLIDINGDALPDVLDTGASGAHRFFVNTMDAAGKQGFAAPTTSSETRGGSAFTLSAPGVQVVDVNGDGFSDMIHTVANRVLCNRGSGDWDDGDDCAASVSIEGLSEDEAGDSDPLHIRFYDYDNDKRIDLLHTTSDDHTVVMHNLAGGFAEVTVEPIGKVFDDSALQLGDINGDGLLDPVEIASTGGLSYRLNLGRGHWGPWVTRALSGVAESELAEADLQDLNGDGLDDVVVVTGNTVQYALNRAGSFLPFAKLSADDVEGELPTRTDSTTVLFADMNASGTTDVVWITSAGEVRFLELFAVRPNLLTRIENGIGGVQLTEYGTSAREQARDQSAGLPWRYRLPQAMNVVTATDSYATLTPEVRNRVEVTYHHGFYDGVEKRYRGFEQVEQYEPADEAGDSQEPGLTIVDFDVGASDPYYSGKLLRQQVYGGPLAARYLVQRSLEEYDDCPLSEVPTSGLRLPVRHVCSVASETLLQEGRPEAEWVTLRSERQYDGYGNLVLNANHGVTGMGARGRDACGVCTAPEGTLSGACGGECLGDEAYSETEYVAPGEATGGVWIVGQPSRSIGYGVVGGAYTEQLFYYDGDAFVGLSRGKLTRGNVSRSCARVTSDAAADCQREGWVQTVRAKHDAHGNEVETLDPLGAPDDESGHRSLIQYDAHGLKPTAVEIFLSNDDGAYRLRRETNYDPIFDQPASTTRWMLVGASVSSEPAPTSISYDAFGRRSAIAQPGDSLDTPTSEFTYELSDPVSTIVVRTRSVSGGAPDLETRQCVDGFGRAVQTKTLLQDHLFQVAGFNEVNRRGKVVRAYQAYQETTRPCGRGVPSDVKYTSYRYDALGRALSVTSPDEELYGQASVTSTAHAPLVTIQSDAEDNDSLSPAFKTPHVTRVDGLGRVITMERYLGDRTKGAETGSVTALYDELGHMTGYLDAKGYRKAQRFDLLGRVLHVDDPNAGPLDLAYDAAGNLIERRNALGQTVMMKYDGANRPVAQWHQSSEQTSLVETRYDFVSGCAECSNGEGKALVTRYPLGSDRGDGIDEMGYDLRGRTVLSARSLSGHRFVTTAKYDNAGRLTVSTYPDGSTLAHHHDTASRLVGIDGVLDAVNYDVHGLVDEAVYANGVRVKRTYDVLQRVAEAQTVGPDGAVLQGFGYRLDRAGNMLAIEDLSSERRDRLTWSARFSHDAWYRVITASYGQDGDANAETIGFAFDAVDNIVSKVSSRGAQSSAHIGDYTYDPSRPNAVTQAGNLEYAYDDAGQLLRRGETEFAWDYQGRLTEASVTDGRVAEYVYGAGADRVMELSDGSVTYYVGPSFEVHDGVSSTYARVGRERVARKMSAALQTKLLVDVAPEGKADGKIDAADAWLVALAGDDPSAHLKAGARRLLLEHTPDTVFLHHDHLGSVTLATAAEGQVVGERSFDPTGGILAERGYVDAYGFTGQRRDERTGLTHFQFRELDAFSGRWASPDPMFAAARADLLRKWGESTTAYAYAGGGFASRTDPTGLMFAMARLGASSAPARQSLRQLHVVAKANHGTVPGHIQVKLNAKETVAVKEALMEMNHDTSQLGDTMTLGMRPKVGGGAKRKPAEGVFHSERGPIRNFTAAAESVTTDPPLQGDKTETIDLGDQSANHAFIQTLARLVAKQPHTYELFGGDASEGSANCCTFVGMVLKPLGIEVENKGESTARNRDPAARPEEVMSQIMAQMRDALSTDDE